MSITRLRHAPRVLLAAATFGTLVVASAVNAAGHTDAQPRGADCPHHDNHHGSHHLGRKGGSTLMMKRLDLDGDGVITRAEFDLGTADRFARRDVDGDGSLSVDEIRRERAAWREQRTRAEFARMDADGDGRISIEEYVAMADRRFSHLDRNDDGVIQADELRRRMHRDRGSRRAAD